MVLAVEEVKCVEGCGDTLPVVIGLIVALASAGLSSFAVWTSRKSLDIAQREHAVFIAERSARTDFEVKLDLQYPRYRHLTALRIGSGQQAIRIRLRITNIGDRVAEPVKANLLYPASCSNDRWTTEEGATLAPGNPMTADESLEVDGEVVATKQVYKELPRLSPQEPLIAFFQVSVVLPQGWDQVEVPFSVRVWADHMPDGVADRRADLPLPLRHAERGG